MQPWDVKKIGSIDIQWTGSEYEIQMPGWEFENPGTGEVLVFGSGAVVSGLKSQWELDTFLVAGHSFKDLEQMVAQQAKAKNKKLISWF